MNVAAHRDVALAEHPFVGGKLELDALVAELPVAADQREIALLDSPFAQLRVQIAKRRATLRDQETSARLAVQAMHEIEFTKLGACRPQRLDHAMRESAAAVHGEARRLVDRNQVRVLVDDRVCHRELQLAAWSRTLDGIGPPDRRQANSVARGDTLVRSGPLAVHAHLTFAQEPVDVGPRYAFELTQQKVVQALTDIAIGGDHVTHLRGRSGLL